jgi:hypothetical protein
VGGGVLLFGLMITMMKMRSSIAGLGLCVLRFINPIMRKFFYISIGLPLMGIMLSSCGKYQSSIEAINAS